MGYNITIGKAQIFYDPDDKYLCLKAKGEMDKKAPAFGEPTDHENQRWPSYSTWTDFVKFVGLEDLFFNDETGLMRSHPGCFPFDQSDIDEVKKAINILKIKYPKIKAEFNEEKIGFTTREEYYKYITENPMFVAGGHLCRLLWLDYWMTNALKKYKIPVIENT